MFLFRAECQDSILAQFSELPAGASRLHFGSFRQNGTRCMPESLGAPGLRKRTPPTRSLFASFAGCRQDNRVQAGDTCIGLERWACWLSGPARSRGGGGPSEKATSQPFLAQLISVERVLNTSATKKDMQVVMRRFSSTLVAAGVVKF